MLQHVVANHNGPVLARYFIDRVVDMETNPLCHRSGMLAEVVPGLLLHGEREQISPTPYAILKHSIPLRDPPAHFRRKTAAEDVRVRSAQASAIGTTLLSRVEVCRSAL